MGSYTATQKFYKPAGNEFVDVEAQVNNNWENADNRVRSLIEWQYVPSNYLTIPDAYPIREAGMKYYKASTNACQHVASTSGTLVMDSNSSVLTWTGSSISFFGGYRSQDEATQRISYVRDSVGDYVRFRGALILNLTMDQIPRNQNITVMNLPTTIRPTRSKYFYVHMGIVTANYACCRILINTTGDVEINKMGADQSDPAQRYISFNDVRYPIGD